MGIQKILNAEAHYGVPVKIFTNDIDSDSIEQLKKMAQLQKNSTTAKFHVGILQKISTTAKKMAQLRNKMYNCKKKSTTAKHIYCSCIFFGNT